MTSVNSKSYLKKVLKKTDNKFRAVSKLEFHEEDIKKAEKILTIADEVHLICGMCQTNKLYKNELIDGMNENKSLLCQDCSKEWEFKKGYFIRKATLPHLLDDACVFCHWRSEYPEGHIIHASGSCPAMHLKYKMWLNDGEWEHSERTVEERLKIMNDEPSDFFHDCEDRTEYNEDFFTRKINERFKIKNFDITNEEERGQTDFNINFTRGEFKYEYRVIIGEDNVEEIYINYVKEVADEQLRELKSAAGIHEKYIKMDYEKFINDCRIDGRGHFLNSYDGEEIKLVDKNDKTKNIYLYLQDKNKIEKPKKVIEVSDSDSSDDDECSDSDSDDDIDDEIYQQRKKNIIKMMRDDEYFKDYKEIEIVGHYKADKTKKSMSIFQLHLDGVEYMAIYGEDKVESVYQEKIRAELYKDLKYIFDIERFKKNKMKYHGEFMEEMIALIYEKFYERMRVDKKLYMSNDGQEREIKDKILGRATFSLFLYYQG